jgi:hypothetical protein
MKSSQPASISVIMLAGALVAGCASKTPSPVESLTPPAPAPAVAAPAETPAKAPAKVARQRIVVTKVPVLVKESSFYSDGLPDQYVVYKLDNAKKNLIEKDSYDASRPEPVQRLVAEYRDGLLVAESVYESDGSLRSRRELSYAAAGLLAQERLLDSKGKAQSSSSYAYDASSRKTEWRAMDASGSVKATSAYAYGAQGLLDVTMKDGAGRLTGTIKLEYAGDKLAKRSYYGADGALQKYEAYVYQGGLLSALEYRRADGSLVSKTAYSYGPSGELLKAVEQDASGKAGAYTTYEYAVREDSSTETYFE